MGVTLCSLVTKYRGQSVCVCVCVGGTLFAPYLFNIISSLDVFVINCTDVSFPLQVKKVVRARAESNGWSVTYKLSEIKSKTEKVFKLYYVYNTCIYDILYQFPSNLDTIVHYYIHLFSEMGDL